MKKVLQVVFVLIGLFLMSACSSSEKGIEIQNVWARPAIQGGNGAVYFLLQNQSSTSDELTGATSDIADAVEIHLSSMDGDVMQMQHMMSVPVDAQTSVEFAPGGFHVMLIGLKQDLQIGDEFQVTLQFKQHEDIVVKVKVQENADMNSMPNP